MKSQESPNTDTSFSLVISYLTLRRIIGILGIAFPVILAAGNCLFGNHHAIQTSISSYYHTIMRDVFVGILTAVGLFLFTYKGHNFIDNLAGNLGCVFALGVAFIPTTPDNPSPGYNLLPGKLHLIFATLFFIVLIKSSCLMIFFSKSM